MDPESQESPASVSSEAIHRLTVRMRVRLGSVVRDLQIFLHPDGLVLVGRADTYYAKQLARHAAMEISGRAILANEIEVEETS